MLTYLKIKNFALIENAEIEFGDRFNVITGESGSGKSIIFGALSLLSGDRADKNIIRTNSERCEVFATFKIPEELYQKVYHVFELNDIDLITLQENRDELYVRRVISNSSSRNYINDNLVSSKILQQISSFFFDFNQPADELSLNSQARQLELLDKFANIDCSECQKKYSELLACKSEIIKFDEQLPNSDDIEEAKSLIAEFELVNPAINEDITLSNRHKILANSQEIINLSGKLVNGLTDDENSIIDLMAGVTRELYNFNRLSENSASEIVEDAELISENIRNLSANIEHFVSKMELDGEEFYTVENRLSQIHKLKRKFGPTLEEVFSNYENALKIIEQFNESAKNRSILVERELELRASLKSQCELISQQRKNGSQKLTELMIKELQEIGFTNPKIEWLFNEITPSVRGFDEVDILFCANKGEKLYPLRQIASSGERSRLFLAIKSVLAKVDDIPTVIFDEIDANIGGDTANKVANALSDLAKFRQVILISHLAQVASKATTHLKVFKKVIDNRTLSNVEVLDNDKLIYEIARLLGGNSNLEIAKLHAQELLRR